MSYQLQKVWKVNLTSEIDFWPSDLNINRDHLLIKDYLSTKFEYFEAFLSCPLQKVWKTNMTLS